MGPGIAVRPKREDMKNLPSILMSKVLSFFVLGLCLSGTIPPRAQHAPNPSPHEVAPRLNLSALVDIGAQAYNHREEGFLQ
jgi:hypothetical protein